MKYTNGSRSSFSYYIYKFIYSTHGDTKIRIRVTIDFKVILGFNKIKEKGLEHRVG